RPTRDRQPMLGTITPACVGSTIGAASSGHRRRGSFPARYDPVGHLLRDDEAAEVAVVERVDVRLWHLPEHVVKRVEPRKAARLRLCDERVVGLVLIPGFGAVLRPVPAHGLEEEVGVHAQLTAHGGRQLTVETIYLEDARGRIRGGAKTSPRY